MATVKKALMNTPVQAKKPAKEKPTGQDASNLWTRRIAAALRWRRQHWNGDKNWDLAFKIYRGNHWEQQDQDTNDLSSDNVNDRITVNITGSTILNLLPFLYNRRTEFFAKGRRPETEVSAQINQALLNYAFEHAGIQKQIKRAVLDSIICGHGIVKTGYIIEVDQARAKDQGEIIYEDFVKVDTPYARRISPFMFLFDPTSPTKTPEGGRWVAEIFFATYEDVIANDKYDKKVINKIESGEYTLTQYHEVFPEEINTTDAGGLSNNLKDSENIYDVPEDKVVVLYEVWDKKHRKVRIFADGCPEPLFEKAWPYEYLTEFPYVRTEFIQIPDQHYPVGIPYFVRDQQFELNRIRSTMFAHRRKFKRFYEVTEAVNPEERQKVVTVPDGGVVVVPAINSINPVQDAPLNQDQAMTEGYIKQDVQELTGSDALFRGGSLPSRTTAGEVSARTNLFRMKLDDRVEEVDSFILDIGKQILKHIQGNFIANRAVEILGEQGKYWVEATADDIAAEVDITMESVAAPKTDPVLERQQALQILQIANQMLPLVQAGLVKLDFNELLKWVLEKFGNKDIGRFFANALIPVAPLQQQPIAPSNNLNPAGLPDVGQAGQDVNSIQQEGGFNDVLNQSGLQLGGLLQ